MEEALRNIGEAISLRLLIASLMIVGAALIFLFTVLGNIFRVSPPDISFLLMMAIIVVLYIILEKW